MNEKTVCPLCGVVAPYGKCPSCGYVIPDDIDLDYNTKLNDLDPEDYPNGEVMRNIMDDAPLPEKHRFDLMPDVNDVSSETPVYADPKQQASVQREKSNIPAENIGQAQPPIKNISKKELAAAAAIFLLALLPVLPVELFLFGGIALLFLRKGSTELMGLAAVIAVILRLMCEKIWNGLF